MPPEYDPNDPFNRIANGRYTPKEKRRLNWWIALMTVATLVASGIGGWWLIARVTWTEMQSVLAGLGFVAVIYLAWTALGHFLHRLLGVPKPRERKDTDYDQAV